MKTVQEWLNAVDEDTLIDAYINNFNAIKYDLDPDKSVEEVRATCIANLRDYLHRTKTKKVIDRRNEWVFFATPHPTLGYIDIPVVHLKLNVKLCYQESLLDENEPEFDTWATALPEEVFGCAIAETEYTINNMYQVLSQIIWDNTFYGYEDDSNTRFKEELAEEDDDVIGPLTAEELIEMIDEALDESEDEAKTYFDLPIPVLQYGNSYIPPEESKESFEDKLRELAIEYGDYLQNIELAKVRECLSISES